MLQRGFEYLLWFHIAVGGGAANVGACAGAAISTCSATLVNCRPFAGERMNLIFRLLFFVSFVLISSQQVRSEEDVLSGRWQQISSNAGSCPNCAIGIVKHGTVFTVSANNGWTATVRADRHGPASYATGEGRWKLRPGATYDNKPFDVLFSARGEELMMVMIVDLGNGSKTTIKATFARSAPGAPHTKA